MPSLDVNINGFPLPNLLCDLIESDQWRRPDDVSALRELTRVERPEEFSFMDPDRMARETDAARKLAANPVQARIYGIRASRDMQQPIADDTALDIDRAIMIAINWDEDAIFLDYRNTLDPTVMLSYWPEDAGTVLYREIAASFDNFATRIGLISAGTDHQQCV